MQLFWVVIRSMLRSLTEVLPPFGGVFFNHPIPGLSFSSHVLYYGSEMGSETETDRCSGVWCLTCSRSVRSSQGGDTFDSSDSLTMITLSIGVLLKVRGQPQLASKKNKHVYRVKRVIWHGANTWMMRSGRKRSFKPERLKTFQVFNFIMKCQSEVNCIINQLLHLLEINTV